MYWARSKWFNEWIFPMHKSTTKFVLNNADSKTKNYNVCFKMIFLSAKQQTEQINPFFIHGFFYTYKK